MNVPCEYEIRPQIYSAPIRRTRILETSGRFGWVELRLMSPSRTNQKQKKKQHTKC